MDLERDNRALENALNPAAPSGEQRVIDFQPMNGIQMLRLEFGEEFDALSAASLRKFEYDASRAAEFMRQKNLPTQFTIAKIRLGDLEIQVENQALAQLCVTVRPHLNLHQGV